MYSSIHEFFYRGDLATGYYSYSCQEGKVASSFLVASSEDSELLRVTVNCSPRIASSSSTFYFKSIWKLGNDFCGCTTCCKAPCPERRLLMERACTIQFILQHYSQNYRYSYVLESRCLPAPPSIMHIFIFVASDKQLLKKKQNKAHLDWNPKRRENCSTMVTDFSLFSGLLLIQPSGTV